MSEDWQIGFKVEGLVAPEKQIIFSDYILIRGVPRRDSSYVFFKFTLRNEEEQDEVRDDFKNVLRNITQMYGLVTNIYSEALLSSVTAKISSENPFGHTKYSPEFSLVPVIGDEQRRKNIPFLKKTIAKYETVKNIFKNRRKSYLRNAIDYYYRSLGDFHLEEKLIDLMISLESLFSRETQELRLRISLRASFFLSVGQESRLPKIFRDVYELYDKRSKVVHGIEDADLNSTKIWILEDYVREAIKRFIHIEMQKEDILRLVDESVYDEEKRKQLNQIVLEATKKW